MNKYLKHLIVVVKHKYFVAIECFKLGLYWQGIVHDLSKFSITEFAQSAKYFQGTETPINKIKVKLGYSKAWLHHKGRNKHHWEYWIDFYDGVLKPCPIPEKYLKEMCCDMIGASKAYNKEKYNNQEPLNYFLKHKNNWVATEETLNYVENFLTKVANNLTN